MMKKIALAVLLVTGAGVVTTTDAYAYRCGQSRPCAGGFNPYNPGSYNSPRYYGPRPTVPTPGPGYAVPTRHRLHHGD